MLWSTLTITTQLYVVFGCSLVLAISLVFVVCFLLPDGWSLCPTEASDYDPRQDAFADEYNIPLSHLEKYRSTIEHDVASSPPLSPTPHNKDDRILSAAESIIKTYRMSSSSSTTAFSVDSSGGRPSSSSGIGSSSSVISETSPASSRRTSLAPLPSDCEAAVCQSSSTPQIHLTIHRCPIADDDDETKHQLTLIIENATGLPRRTYVNTADPTVIVRLERSNGNKSARSSTAAGFVSALIERASFRSSANANKENELVFLDASCPVAYHCRNPGFRHVIQLPVLSEADRIEDCQLVLRVEDRDKLVGTSELCSCRIGFSEIVDLLTKEASTESGSIHLTRHLLQQPASNRRGNDGKGEVLLGLSFLPTSQRITVRITQFEHLPKWTAGSSDHAGQVIVRLFVLNESGRVVKKRKTAPRQYPPDGRIEFDEQFAIELDVERWQRSVVLVVLSRIVELHQRAEAAGSASSSRGRVPPVYEHMGHVALGRRVAGVAERIHWNSGLQMPRRVVSQWHHLH